MLLSLLSFCSAELNQEGGDDCTRCIGMLVREYIWLFEGVTFCAELDCKDSDSSMRCIDDELNNRLVLVSTFSGELDCGGVDDKTSCLDDDDFKEGIKPSLASTLIIEVNRQGDDDNTLGTDDKEFITTVVDCECSVEIISGGIDEIVYCRDKELVLESIRLSVAFICQTELKFEDTDAMLCFIDDILVEEFKSLFVAFTFAELNCGDTTRLGVASKFLVIEDGVPCRDDKIGKESLLLRETVTWSAELKLRDGSECN